MNNLWWNLHYKQVYESLIVKHCSITRTYIWNSLADPLSLAQFHLEGGLKCCSTHNCIYVFMWITLRLGSQYDAGTVSVVSIAGKKSVCCWSKWYTYRPILTTWLVGCWKCDAGIEISCINDTLMTHATQSWHQCHIVNQALMCHSSRGVARIIKVGGQNTRGEEND